MVAEHDERAAGHQPALPQRAQPGARIRLGFCLWCYPMFALPMLTSVLLPIVAIATGAPFMRPSAGSFYGPFLPARASAARRRCGYDCSAGCARTMLAALHGRWPGSSSSAGRGPCSAVCTRSPGGSRVSFKVTPGDSGPGVVPVPMRVIGPYLGLDAISALPSLLGLSAGAARGYYRLATHQGHALHHRRGGDRRSAHLRAPAPTAPRGASQLPWPRSGRSSRAGLVTA